MKTLLRLDLNIPLQSNGKSVCFLTTKEAIAYAKFKHPVWAKHYSIIPYRDLTSLEKKDLKEKGIRF